MPFLSIVFIAYAVGGQSLLRKYLPFLAEKDKTTEVAESDKKLTDRHSRVGGNPV